LTKRQPSPIERAAPTRRSPPVVVDVTGVERPDIGTVDALCLVALEARRNGCPVQVRGAARSLCELIELAGLVAVLGARSERPRLRDASRRIRTGRHAAGPFLDSPDQLPGVSQTG
jgi:ABC-type transporter Mla MlaB component